MKKLASVALALTAAGALAACGSGSGSGGPPDSGPITIGSIHPTSGDLAGVGSLMDDGAKMAVDDINKAGGIKALDGRKLKLSSGDSQGKAEVGQSEAQRMIDDGAVALVGTYQSDVTQNVASVAERGRVPLVIDVAVDDKILDQGYKYTFRVQPNATSMGTSGAESLAKIGKDAGDPITRVAYLHIEGAFGDSVFNAFKAKAAEAGDHRHQGDHLPAHQLLRRHHPGARGRGVQARRHRGHRLLPRRCAHRQGRERAQAGHQGSLRHRQRRLRRRLLPERCRPGRAGRAQRELPLRREELEGPGRPQALRAEVRQADGDRLGALLPGGRGGRRGPGEGEGAPTRRRCARASRGSSSTSRCWPSTARSPSTRPARTRTPP